VSKLINGAPESRTEREPPARESLRGPPVTVSVVGELLALDGSRNLIGSTVDVGRRREPAVRRRHCWSWRCDQVRRSSGDQFDGPRGACTLG